MPTDALAPKSSEASHPSLPKSRRVGWAVSPRGVSWALLLPAPMLLVALVCEPAGLANTDPRDKPAKSTRALGCSPRAYLVSAFAPAPALALTHAPSQPLSFHAASLALALFESPRACGP
eukprot:6197335-Pleurochrysis_carterae.AAC.1